MDAIREKLVELIGATRYGENDRSTVGKNFQRGFIEKIADNLISNGVTVLTPDEAKNVYTVQEIEKLQGEAYDLGAESVLHNHFGLSWHDAAEVRKEVARLQAASGWIPASEPPEKAGWYQVHTSPEKGHKSINKAQYCKEPSWCVDAGKGSWHGSGGIWTNVTHWRPLPEPPGKDVNGNA